MNAKVFTSNYAAKMPIKIQINLNKILKHTFISFITIHKKMFK